MGREKNGVKEIHRFQAQGGEKMKSTAGRGRDGARSAGRPWIAVATA
jgi:hypothetical protein